jgi:predicted nucleic acid-binding protein
MAVYFLDSSALVKRYIRETGTDWVASLFSPDFGNDCFVAAIAGVEIIAAITRRARSGSLKAADATLVCAQFKQDFPAIVNSKSLGAETLENSFRCNYSKSAGTGRIHRLILR